MQRGLGLTVGLLTLGVGSFVVVQRYGFLSKLLGWLSACKICRARLERWRQHLLPLEASLAAYYMAHPWRFGLSLGLHGSAFVFNSLQTFLALRLLLGAGAPSVAEAILVTSAVAALDQVFFFVPGGLGTAEGVRFAMLSTLGVAQVSGLAFGLMARLEGLVWNGCGLLAYAWYTRPWCGLRRVQAIASSSPSLPRRRGKRP